jgi:hypothetical protein
MLTSRATWTGPIHERLSQLLSSESPQGRFSWFRFPIRLSSFCLYSLIMGGAYKEVVELLSCKYAIQFIETVCTAKDMCRTRYSISTICYGSKLPHWITFWHVSHLSSSKKPSDILVHTWISSNSETRQATCSERTLIRDGESTSFIVSPARFRSRQLRDTVRVFEALESRAY